MEHQQARYRDLDNRLEAGAGCRNSHLKEFYNRIALCNSNWNQRLFPQEVGSYRDEKSPSKILRFVDFPPQPCPRYLDIPSYQSLSNYPVEGNPYPEQYLSVSILLKNQSFLDIVLGWYSKD